MTKNFSELNNIGSTVEVRPLEIRPNYAKISICRGNHIGILLRNLTTMKELTALKDKDMGDGSRTR